jgi:hypothetical protein
MSRVDAITFDTVTPSTLFPAPDPPVPGSTITNVVDAGHRMPTAKLLTVPEEGAAAGGTWHTGAAPSDFEYSRYLNRG